ncbi:Protein of unknown function DUF58 [Halopseudomonas xinjiangensis]|uniref:DUF58 domain-containing protein n=1 Tax=Halopseudomonas xinjiangensis TaxID=487184 RepID=A0A1H1S527_9GAMM|nr:DUF58 domain-containing protein [Halopseudomonas xinjiangensis]SDS43061.1 Protein of unknown function DUF58 [Halopseudomonas xinjiangensis]
MPLESSGVITDVTLESLLGARQHCQQLPLFSRPMRTSRQAGRQYSRLRGRGVDFDQVRAYQPGDDIRNIDWRVTARSQKVHTKVFNEERERPVFIICEQSSRLCFGSQRYFKTALAAEACALIAWTALCHNDRVGGMVFAPDSCHEVRPRRSRGAILQLFRLLLEANALASPGLAETGEEPNEPLNLALRHSREIIRPGSILYLLCDHSAVDLMQQSLLAPLAAHNDLILLPVHDPLDAELPQHGPLAFVQDGREMTIDTDDHAVRAAYHAQFLDRQTAWQHLANRMRCTLNPLDTTQAPVEQLRSMLAGTAARRR